MVKTFASSYHGQFPNKFPRKANQCSQNPENFHRFEFWKKFKN